MSDKSRRSVLISAIFALMLVPVPGYPSSSLDPAQAQLLTGLPAPDSSALDITTPPPEAAPPSAPTSTTAASPSGCYVSGWVSVEVAACWRRTPWNKTEQAVRSRCSNYRCSGNRIWRAIEDDHNIEYCTVYSTVALLAWGSAISSGFEQMAEKDKTDWVINTGENLHSSYPISNILSIVGAEAFMSANGIYGRTKDEVFNFAMNMCLDGDPWTASHSN